MEPLGGQLHKLPNLPKKAFHKSMLGDGTDESRGHTNRQNKGLQSSIWQEIGIRQLTQAVGLPSKSHWIYSRKDVRSSRSQQWVINLCQQGQVDWVSLSNSSLSFSVEVLARFSKAGVEMITVAIGQAIFSPFKVPPEGQKRLSEAVSKLQAFSSYGKILWFGFGIKHVVKTLCETEQGSACAAMCACLSVSYDTFYSSQVLRELSAHSLTPTALTPALSQWAALLNVCAGAVTDSQFPALVEGFSSLTGFPCRGREIRPLQQPTNPKALAGALLELANVSNGTTNSVTFEGGADCGWIAAVAQWLFGLRLQILDPSGSQLYSNLDARTGAELQVTIIKNIHDGSTRTETLVSSRSFLVPAGSISLRLVNDGLDDASAQHLFSKGRSNWSSILYDTFGSAFHDLLKEETISVFASFLCKAVVGQAEHRAAIKRSPWEYCRRSDIRSRLAAFLSAAAHQLPELQGVRRVAIEDPNIFKDAEAFFLLDFDKYDYKVGLQELRCLCPCINCLDLSDCCEQGLAWGDYKKFDQSPIIVCLERIAFAIFEFLWTLSWLDLHKSIQPSSTGLTMVYHYHRYDFWEESVERAKNQMERGIGLGLFSLFNGLVLTNQAYARNLSAACDNGLCIYHQSLVLLDAMPLPSLILKVMPGQIEFNERIYSRVSDQAPPKNATLKHHPSQYLDAIGLSPLVELLVEETIASDELKARFRLLSRASPADYLGSQPVPGRALDDRWDRESIPHNLQSIRPRTLWRNLVQRSKWSIDQCTHSKVEVLIKQYPVLASDPVLTQSWTGQCSEMSSMGDLNCLPRAGEWVLVDYSRESNYTEVVRAKPAFMYYFVCNADVYSRAVLVRTGNCFLCDSRIYRRGQERIVIHSFLDGTVATPAEILCTDINENSEPIDSIPSVSPPLSPEPSPEAMPS